MPETILIVDDENPVRQTFREWLEGGGLNCRVLACADAESALKLANEHTIDLAILDWNLGAGNDGLSLLQDLGDFNPDIVAILITGYAAQATPLSALRMGVRDYLDKNQDLNKDTFLASVRRQLERIAPAKREREVTGGLRAFRETVEKVLPLVQSAAALNDPVPLPEAIGSLFRFLLRGTRASDGVLLVRHADGNGQTYRAYGAAGQPLDAPLVPFAHSLAATAVSLQEPCVVNQLDGDSVGAAELQPFEHGRSSLLAAPLNVAPGLHVVLELFDKQSPDRTGPAAFTEDDRKLVGTAAEFGSELLRQALAERQTHRLLFDAVDAALTASRSVEHALSGTPEQRREQPPPDAVMERLREGLDSSAGALVDSDDALRLAEAVRVLALRHGPPAVRHCIELVESLRKLLDGVTGADLEG
jgi:CheY-like chemotaxis protein